MPRYLIELSHDDEYAACVRALHAVEGSGSHLITNIDWGCNDGVHRGWLIVEVESREEAMGMVPPEARHDARVIQLNRFTREQIVRLVAELGG